MAMAQQQAQMAVLQGQVQLLQAQANESQSRANKYNTETELAPTELTLKYSDQNNDGVADKDFERRVKMAELLLREQELEGEAEHSESEKAKAAKAEAELIRQLTEMGGAAAQGGAGAPQAPQQEQ